MLLVRVPASVAGVIFAQHRFHCSRFVKPFTLSARSQGRCQARVFASSSKMSIRFREGHADCRDQKERATVKAESPFRELPMTLARLILVNALARLVSRTAEAVNIKLEVAANFTKPNPAIVAFKQHAVIRPCCTSA